jgi:hypothetical protein
LKGIASSVCNATGDIPEFVVKANSVTQPLCIDTMRSHIKQNRNFLGQIVDDVRVARSPSYLHNRVTVD